MRAAGKAVYESLRNGKRADVAWEDISRDHQGQIICAFAAGLAQWSSVASGGA
jgi:hypothetical protein